MGMNYHIESFPPCETCGHIAEKKHLGKQSFSWAFLFRGYPEEDLVSWKSWEEKIMSDGYLIKNEEGKLMLLKDFIKMINKTKPLKKADLSYDLQEYLDPEGFRFHNGIFS